MIVINFFKFFIKEFIIIEKKISSPHNYKFFFFVRKYKIGKPGLNLSLNELRLIAEIEI